MLSGLVWHIDASLPDCTYASYSVEDMMNSTPACPCEHFCYVSPCMKIMTGSSTDIYLQENRKLIKATKSNSHENNTRGNIIGYISALCHVQGK